VSSKTIASVFSKSHHKVLRDIQQLECSDDFRESNFGLSSYVAGKRKYKCYKISRDGFAFLAMGFTGKKAAQFKEAYINAFNQMEVELSENTKQLPSYQNPIDRIDFMYQRWMVLVEKGQITSKCPLNDDEYFFNRRQFINFFKEPSIGFNDLDQLIELSKAVNERIGMQASKN